jgi:hypothetical protein
MPTRVICESLGSRHDYLLLPNTLKLDCQPAGKVVGQFELG